MAENAVKVSIVVPNYNHAAFLGRRMDSILAQTYTDYEIILLDDASTDGSRKVIEAYRDKANIRIQYRESNSGNTFVQWNAGVRMARGEYIWIAESDDYSSNRFLEKLVDILDQNPSVGLAYCQSYKVDESDRVVGMQTAYAADLDVNHWRQSYVNRGVDECVRYLVMKNTIPNASAVIFRKSVYEAVGGADEDSVLSGDWKLWVDMLRVSDVAFTSMLLNYQRFHIGTVRAKTDRMGKRISDGFWMIRYIDERFDLPEGRVEEAVGYTLGVWARSVCSGTLRPVVSGSLALRRECRALFAGVSCSFAWALSSRVMYLGGRIAIIARKAVFRQIGRPLRAFYRMLLRPL